MINNDEDLNLELERPLVELYFTFLGETKNRLGLYCTRKLPTPQQGAETSGEYEQFQLDQTGNDIKDAGSSVAFNPFLIEDFLLVYEQGTLTPMSYCETGMDVDLARAAVPSAKRLYATEDAVTDIVKAGCRFAEFVEKPFLQTMFPMSVEEPKFRAAATRFLTLAYQGIQEPEYRAVEPSSLEKRASN